MADIHLLGASARWGSMPHANRVRKSKPQQAARRSWRDYVTMYVICRRRARPGAQVTILNCRRPPVSSRNGPAKRSAKMADTRQTVQLGHNLLIFEPILVDLGCSWANFARTCSRFGRHRANVGRFQANFGRSWPILGQVLSKAGRMRPNPGKRWSIPPKCWPNLADFGPKSGETSANNRFRDRFRPNVSRIRALLALGPNLANSTQIGKILAESGG